MCRSPSLLNVGPSSSKGSVALEVCEPPQEVLNLGRLQSRGCWEPGRVWIRDWISLWRCGKVYGVLPREWLSALWSSCLGGFSYLRKGLFYLLPFYFSPFISPFSFLLLLSLCSSFSYFLILSLSPSGFAPALFHPKTITLLRPACSVCLTPSVPNFPLTLSTLISHSQFSLSQISTPSLFPHLLLTLSVSSSPSPSSIAPHSLSFPIRFSPLPAHDRPCN